MSLRIRASLLPVLTLCSVAPVALAADAARGSHLARAVDRSLGGETFRRQGFLAFRFEVELDGRTLQDRTYRWDRQRGRCRITGSDARGRRLNVLLDTENARGRVLRDGVPLDGQEGEALLDEYYLSFLSDTYWLLMPFKLADPGVVVRDGGTTTLPGGDPVRVLRLSFAPGTGRTPSDRFRVWIDPATHRVAGWEYWPGGRAEQANAALWTGWVENSGVWFSTEKVFPDDPRVIRISGITLAAEAPEGALDSREALQGDEEGR